jgi:hypothetical protein
MSRFYVATTLANSRRAALVAEYLEIAGHEITFPWWNHVAYSPEAITAEFLEGIGDAEMAGVLAADVVIALTPAGRGTLCEVGMALGAKIPVIVHCETGVTWLPGATSCSFLFLQRGIRRSRGVLSNAVNIRSLVELAGIAHECGVNTPQYGHAAGVLASLKKADALDALPPYYDARHGLLGTIKREGSV